MPWYFPWSDGLKKRACRYLLQRYLGQFLQKNLALDQLSVDLYSGKGTIHDVYLDAQALNELGEKYAFPIEFVDGFVGSVSVSIPWSSLLSDSSVVEVHGLMITLQPKQKIQTASLKGSLLGSMMSSLQIAEECFKDSSLEDEKDFEQSQKLEGLELFAQTIDTVFRRVKVSFTDTVVRLEHFPCGQNNGVALELRIKKVEYFDEAGIEETIPPEEPPSLNLCQPVAFSTKKFCVEGVSIYTDEFSARNHQLWKSYSSSGLKTPERSGTLSPGYVGLQPMESGIDESKSPSEEEEGICDPILIAKLLEQQEVRLKLKEDENISGPQFEIELNFGLVPIILSPRQVHIFLEILHSLKNPGSRKANRKQSINKPMDREDFNLVEQELQKHLGRPLNLAVRSLKQQQGWSTHSLDDSEDEFHPMHGGIRGSKITESYDMDSSLGSQDLHESVSSMGSSKPFTGRMGKNIQGFLDETHSDETKFQLSCSSVCLFLLQEDVYMSSNATPEKSQDSPSANKISEKFFEDFFHLFRSEHSIKQLIAAREKMTAICGFNHIRLIASPVVFNGQRKLSSSQRMLSTNLTINNFELFECLVDKMNTSSNGQKQVATYTELLKFTDVTHYAKDIVLPTWNEPSVRIKYVQKDNYSQVVQSTLSLQMGILLTEIDITIVDRLHSLFNWAPNRLKWPNGNGTAPKMDEERSVSTTKTDVHLSSPFVVVNIRFPIPDLRPVNSLERPPWWKKNLRDELLIIELSEATLSSSWNASALDSKFELQCKDAHGLFQLCKAEPPFSFCRIAVDPRADKNSAEHGFDWPRLVLKKCPAETPSVLEAEMEDEFDSIHPASSMHTYLNHMNAPSVSPFTSRKVVYDRSSPESKQNSNLGDAADQVIMPAEKEQMNDFIDKSMTNCKITVEISLPTLNVFLPSKTFYEVLYNRISTDLVFWEPAAPKPVYSSESLYQSYHPNSHLIKESTYFEAFSVCKSGAQCDSSSDSDDGGTGGYYSFYDGGMKQNVRRRKSNSTTQIRAQSNLAVFVTIGQGILNCFISDTSSNESALEEQTIGEFQINVEDGMFFFVSGHNGSPEVSYTCLNLNQGTLFHCGASQSPIPRIVKPAILRAPHHLKKTVYRSDAGALPILNSATMTGEHCDLFSLVVRTGLDPNQGLKTFKVALGLQEATMRHRMSSMSESWISQLIDFFDVNNHPVAGYSPPVVITELHFHLHSCAVDYRPLYLPLRAMATVDNFSISSNLAATTTTSLLRIISEELCLYISNKTDEDPVDLKKSYVCVVDTGLFDLSLRMSDGKDAPVHDLRATNNTVHIHTCSDSCRALQDLINYFASDGDLQTASDTFFDASDEPHSFLYNDGRDVEPSTLVNRLMEDAMLENLDSASDSSVEVEETIEPGSFQVNEPGNLYDNTVTRKDSSNDSDEFCILEDDLGCGIVPVSGEPQVRQLTNSTIRVIENHFAKPVGRSDLLKAPAHFPKAVKRYTLKEMSLIWHLYGGQDFQPLSQEKPEEKKKKARVVIEEAYAWGAQDDYSLSHEVSLNLETTGIAYRKGTESVWANINGDTQNVKRVSFQPSTGYGGQGRSRDILVELQMNKLRFQYESYPLDAEYAHRQVLLIQDLEIRDRLATSEINKLLYQFSSEALPRQTHSNMVLIKALHIRPDPSVLTSECSLRISLKPLRLNIDQDTLLFLCNFFGKLNSSEAIPEDCSELGPPGPEPTSFGPYTTRMETTMCDSGKTDNSDASSSCSRACPPIFFRSLVFSPDVPIQLDYHGKHFDMEQGALAGLLMGLGHLNQSKIILKRISYRHGLLGMDRLSAYAINEWLQDIKKNQLPSLLGGLGPMHSFVQLFQGVRDLIWLPIEQYRKDGRIMRGIQRGANSFTTSTTMAFLELTNRMVLIIQGAAEFAYDLVSPGPSVKSHSHVVQKKWRLNSQPMDIREGVANAYHVVREGIGDTARNIIRVTSEEHEHKGVPGAVGGVLRQIPPIMVKPIILATEATSNVLGGVRNQLVPDARRDAVEKWRSRNQH